MFSFPADGERPAIDEHYHGRRARGVDGPDKVFLHAAQIQYQNLRARCPGYLAAIWRYR